MQRFQRYGTVFGFDITRLGLELAHQRKQQRVAQGSTTQIPFAGERFDILTSFDVLVRRRRAGSRAFASSSAC